MADKPGQVSINLPPGMTADDFQKAFATFQKARVAGKVRDTATRSAMKRLITAHQREYDGFYDEEYAKAGGT